MENKVVNYLLSALLVICLFTNKTIAQDENFPLGGRSAAMANSAVMLSDIWSVYHNQAGLANIQSITFGGHFENLYFKIELSLKAAALAVPVRPGVFGFNLVYFGYEGYNKAKFALSFAKKLGQRFSAGIQLDYFNTNIQGEYGNQGAVVAEAGVLFEPIDKLLLGCHVFNITQSKIDFYTAEQIPTIFRLGMGYTFGEKLLLTAESEVDNNKEAAVFKTGIEYILLDNLFLRAGISNNPNKHSFGMGYKFYKIQADLGFSKHQVLGYSAHFAASYSF